MRVVGVALRSRASRGFSRGSVACVVVGAQPSLVEPGGKQRLYLTGSCRVFNFVAAIVPIAELCTSLRELAGGARFTCFVGTVVPTPGVGGVSGSSERGSAAGGSGI